MKQNYQTMLENELNNLPHNPPPTLLLHSCCGPCSTYVLSYLAKHFKITVFFYNPNIMPEEEFNKRLTAQKIVIDRLSFPYPIDLVVPPYDVSEYTSVIAGLEQEPERGKRCQKCMELRISKTAEYAAQENFDYFCTTLSVSPHKDAALLFDLSNKYARLHDIKSLPADFKKKNGYLESIRISKELALYRQNYCGCIYAKNKSDE